MKYLGFNLEKPRIGVFDFTCCEGCELQLANKESTLLDFLSLVEVVNFREVSSDRSDKYDVALVEGAISRDDELPRLAKVRSNAKILVALGSCACFGGVNMLKNRFPVEEVVKEVYGKNPVETVPVRKISDVVEVDLEIPGCPVSKDEVEKIVINLVTGADITFPKYPVCMECKANNNVCVIDLGYICLGPITRAGCGAPCPAGNSGCLGCRGPAPEANFDSFMNVLHDRGFADDEIKERMELFGAFSGVTK